VLVVDDGTPPYVGRELRDVAQRAGAALLRLPDNCGKGHAVARGLAALLERAPVPEAVLVMDADGQHPPAAIPDFLRAGAHAELVIGDRLGRTGPMPLERRFSNRASTRLLSLVTGQEVRDSQCGMRLLRGRALHEIAMPPGGYEAETRHLKRCLNAGVNVAWVPIPAIYEGEPSDFRRVRDTLRVLAALLGR
jgi:glycosyltransferase involved in cell wall biosynthesis